MRKKKLIERLLNKFGYVSSEECREGYRTLKAEYLSDTKRLEDQKIDTLAKAIRSVNMVRVAYETPQLSYELNSAADSSAPMIAHTYPRAGNVFQYRILIELDKLQRIVEELRMSSNSYEFHYLKQSILHEIEYNLDALMKVAYFYPKSPIPK